MPRLILPGSYQSIATRFFPPDTLGLEHWGFFGADAQFSGRNHAPGKRDATVIGAPVYDVNSATLTPDSAFIQTDCLQTPSATYIVVARLPDGFNHHLISNFNSASASGGPVARGANFSANQGSGGGDGLISPNLSHSRLVGGVDTLSAVTLTNGAPAAAWVCLAGRVDSETGITKVFNLSAGTSAQGADANPQNLGSGKLRIGSAITPGGTGTKEVALAAIYSVAKADAQITAIYGALKSYFAKRAIAI